MTSWSRPSAPPAGPWPAAAGRCRCCPACASSCRGDELDADRQRPRSDDHGATERGRRGRRRRGAARAAGRRHRAGARARRGRRRGRRRRGPHHRRAARSSRSGSCRPTSSRGWPSRPGDAVTLDAGEFAAGAPPGRAGGQRRRRPPDPHRRAAGRRGGRPAPGGHRLLPPRRARPARARRCWPRARACSCRRGRWRELARLLAAPKRSRCGSASATRRSRSATVRLTHPADRGRVPELPRADPVELPQPAHRRARAAARRRAPGAS